MAFVFDVDRNDKIAELSLIGVLDDAEFESAFKAVADHPDLDIGVRFVINAQRVTHYRVTKVGVEKARERLLGMGPMGMDAKVIGLIRPRHVEAKELQQVWQTVEGMTTEQVMADSYQDLMHQIGNSGRKSIASQFQQ